jgi:hypothetical protein
MQDIKYDESRSKTTEPSLKVAKIVAKISDIMKKEKVKFTPERVQKCRENMRDQLAVGKRITIKKENLELYNENSDPASYSSEIEKSKKELKEELLTENKKIVDLSHKLLKEGKIKAKSQKYIINFFT